MKKPPSFISTATSTRKIKGEQEQQAGAAIIGHISFDISFTIFATSRGSNLSGALR